MAQVVEERSGDRLMSFSVLFLALQGLIEEQRSLRAQGCPVN